MVQAVLLYNSQSTDNAAGKRLSLRAVCISVSNDYYFEKQTYESPLLPKYYNIHIHNSLNN